MGTEGLDADNYNNAAVYTISDEEMEYRKTKATVAVIMLIAMILL